MPTGEDSWHDADAPDKARLVAEKTLQRLRELNARFPDPDLEEAIKKLEAWHDKQRRGEG